MIAEIALEKTSYSFDRLFSYSIPDKMKVEAGMRVKVPFGNGNKSKIGVVFKVREKNESDSNRLKKLLDVIDEKPVLSEELLTIADWMTKRYFCTYEEATRVLIPNGLSQKLIFSYHLNPNIDIDASYLSEFQIRILRRAKRSDFNSNYIVNTLKSDDSNEELLQLVEKGIFVKTQDTVQKVSDAADKMISVKEYDSSKLKSKQQKNVYEFISNCDTVTVNEVTYFVGCTKGVLDKLVSCGAAEYSLREKFRRPSVTAERVKSSEKIILNENQLEVYNKICDSYDKKENKPILLNGITGSGKTSIYIKLAEKILHEGKQAIILVPEISLTSQTVQIFKNAFGDRVAVLHSGLTVAERYDEWKRCKNSEATIVVGTRSAVFAPFDNIGLIVIDEEHDKSYKSDKNPRYDARQIAILRALRTKAVCLLASATPSVESSYQAGLGNYLSCYMNSRYGNAALPEVEVVDALGSDGIQNDLSARTRFLLRKNFDDNKQSIILINRRGYHSFVRCAECREVKLCPNCSVSLNYHYDNNKLVCHYCGYIENFSSTCPNCHQNSMSTYGTGTQRIEDALRELIPEAKILRVDSDSVSLRNNLDELLDDFADRKYDVMVGTQMVSKGLNFENVTLVCVLNIDQMLYADDYSCNERAFDLITQVIGRSGRGRYKGTALIQTEQPENAYIQLAKNQNYSDFYKLEINFRHTLLYPPFCDINVIGFVSPDETLVKFAPIKFTNSLTEALKKSLPSHPIRIFPPTEASVYKVGNKFRYKIVIKTKCNKQYRTLLSEVYKNFLNDKEFKRVSVFIDTNPSENY